MEHSSHVWIGHIYQGAGVAGTAQCEIEMPLCIDPLANLLSTLRSVAQHNYVYCLLQVLSWAGQLQVTNFISFNRDSCGSSLSIIYRMARIFRGYKISFICQKSPKT